MYVIDDDIKDLIETGAATVVGTADAQGRPHVAIAWGPRVQEDRTSVSVFLDSARAAPLLRDLQATGRIAMTVSYPVSYRSVQLKGRSTRVVAPDAEDRDWVQRSREAFMASTALIGDPPGVIRNLWMQDVVRIDFEVEHAFDQTPGPEAGAPL